MALSRHAYPLLLDVTGRLVVIVGGGTVAVRKAGRLLEAGATRIRCVAPDFDPGIPAEVERVPEAYEPRHLDGAGLVFACTDSGDVNDAVVRDAADRGIWVNRADSDDANPGDFIVPARLREGAVTVTVSAGSPALAAAIRDALARRWDERWTEMADAMLSIRPALLAATTLTAQDRAALFRELATEEAMNILAAGGMEGLMNWLRRRFPEIVGPLSPVRGGEG